MGTVSPQARRYILLAITAVVVSYVRHIVQYGKSWTSVSVFFSSCLIHYFLIGIVAAISYVVIKRIEKIFFEYEGSEKGLTFDQSIFYTSVIILISAIVILVVMGFYYFG